MQGLREDEHGHGFGLWGPGLMSVGFRLTGIEEGLEFPRTLIEGGAHVWGSGLRVQGVQGVGCTGVPRS